MTQKQVDAIVKYLKQLGYDGLTIGNPDECGCTFEDLFPCGHNCLINAVCKPAYLHKDEKLYLHKEEDTCKWEFEPSISDNLYKLYTPTCSEFKKRRIKYNGERVLSLEIRYDQDYCHYCGEKIEVVK